MVFTVSTHAEVDSGSSPRFTMHSGRVQIQQDKSKMQHDQRTSKIGCGAWLDRTRGLEQSKQDERDLEEAESDRLHWANTQVCDIVVWSSCSSPRLENCERLATNVWHFILLPEMSPFTSYHSTVYLQRRMRERLEHRVWLGRRHRFNNGMEQQSRDSVLEVVLVHCNRNPEKRAWRTLRECDKELQCGRC